MERRILVAFADYWISVEALRRPGRKIHLAILQDVSGTPPRRGNKSEQGTGKIF